MNSNHETGEGYTTSVNNSCVEQSIYSRVLVYTVLVVTGSDVSSSSSKTLTVAGTNIPRFTALARGFSVTKQPGLFTKMCMESLGQAKLLFDVENTILAGLLHSCYIHKG